MAHSEIAIATWLGALVLNVGAGVEVPQSVSAAMTVQFDGLSIPVLQSVLAVLGVALARPLVPKSAEPAGLVARLLISAIMMLTALAWVIESHPGILFAFVVSIGLGFAGFSLIELMGEQVKAVVSGFFDRFKGGASGTASPNEEDDL